MVTSRDRSLKRNGVQWTGADRRSRLEPQPEGQMTELDNAYVTSDTTEIRRLPGWREVADLRPLEALTISSIVSSDSVTAIAVTGTHYLSDESFVLIEGNTTDPSINGVQPVTVTGVSTFTIPVDTSLGSVINDGTISAVRAGALHGFKQIDKSLVVVGEMIAGRQARSIGTSHVEKSPTSADPTTLHLEGPHGYYPGYQFAVTITNNTMTGVNGPHTATAIDRWAFTIPVDTSGLSEDHDSDVALNVWIRLPSAWVKHQLPSMSSSLQTFDWWKPPVWDSYLSAVFSEAHFGYGRTSATPTAAPAWTSVSAGSWPRTPATAAASRWTSGATTAMR
jgi:hypothetical protein